ncbi:MAG TPA: sulfite exporter TauE/SafE family protein [Armatimonadetes bacterium]|nr:sulfite exporter TauE/SafE family protein [Armatimonadota bacterium]
METSLLHLSAVLIGVSKAGFGGGTGVLVTPLLTLVLPPKEVVALMLPLLLATDILSLGYYWRRWDTRNVVALMPGALLGILLGGRLLGMLSDLALKRIIGVLACLFAGLQILRERLPSAVEGYQPRYWHGLGAGMVTGLSSTLAHVGGVITSMFLLPQKLPNRTFVGTTTLLYFLINGSKMPVYLGLGLIDLPLLRRDLPLLPTLALGVLLGIWLNRRVSATLFSRIVLAFVLLTGIKLLLLP